MYKVHISETFYSLLSSARTLFDFKTQFYIYIKYNNCTNSKRYNNVNIFYIYIFISIVSADSYCLEFL